MWKSLLEGGRVLETLRIALDDASPTVVTAAAKSLYGMLGGANIQSAVDLQDFLTPGQSEG